MGACSRVLLPLLAAGLLWSCGDSDSSPSGPEAGEAFALRIVPGQMNPAVPGQRCVLLVTMDPATGGAARLRGHADDAEVRVEPPTLEPDGVAEISIVPSAGVDGDISVLLLAERGGYTCSESYSLTVSPNGMGGGDGSDLAPLAADLRQRFVTWLAAERPELGITVDTEWEGTIVRPGILVVMHYLFFSEAWEMGVSWHVMIPPHDWSRIYLRHRFDETAPSLAFEIPSWSTATSVPREVDPEAVWLTEVTR